jgi:deoxyadenosine/deoxycytidine kinase
VTTGGERSEPERDAVGRQLLVEIMGPAAAGKTTLIRALCSHDARVRAGLDLTKAEYVRPLLRKLVVFFPVWALHHRHDRWLDRREMRSIARLETWSQALERPTTIHGSVAVFDHGPLYKLAKLREFGPALTASEPFDRWWRGSLVRWLEALDIVVMLEAPDEVLLQRVDQRGHWFLDGDHPQEEKAEFLRRYRRAFAEILEGDSPIVLRFRTDVTPVETIATEVLSVIGSMRSTGVLQERSSG